MDHKEVRRRMKVTTNVMQEVIERKMTMFGHVCRMSRDRRVQKVMEGFMEGNNKKVPTLMREAQDRSRWRIIVMLAVDTNWWNLMALAGASELKSQQTVNISRPMPITFLAVMLTSITL